MLNTINIDTSVKQMYGTNPESRNTNGINWGKKQTVNKSEEDLLIEFVGDTQLLILTWFTHSQLQSEAD